jgi:hypothetical protein
MRALDRLRQMQRGDLAQGGCVSFVSASDQESEKIEPRTRAHAAGGQENRKHLTNSLNDNDVDPVTRSVEPADSCSFLEPGTDKTDETSCWPELPPLPIGDEHDRWLRGEVGPARPEPIDWTARPDVIAVVEDLADEGQRPGKIARTLGLTRGEVLTVLRRTGR